MAPRLEGDTSRHEEENERPGRGRRRGPSRRWEALDREWGPPTWGHHHHHHHHDHHQADGFDPSAGRGGRRRERFGDDELAQATRRLIGAIRAAGRDGAGMRDATVAVMDGAARSIYRLLADGAEAPADAGPTGAAHSPEPQTGPQTETETEPETGPQPGPDVA